MSILVDRLLLYVSRGGIRGQGPRPPFQVFFAVTLGGACGILLSAPNVFNVIDQQKVLDHLRAVYNKNKEAAAE